MVGICELCGRDEMFLSEHHLVPKCKGGMKGDKIILCKQCHSQVHAFYDEKTLGKSYNTLQKLLEDDRISKYLKWAKKQKRQKIKTKRGWR